MNQQLDKEFVAGAVNSMTPLQGALEWASRGFYVFPITAGQKAPPLVQDWENAATTDVAQIKLWAKEFTNCNWGCAPSRSGHVVLDLDVKP